MTPEEVQAQVTAAFADLPDNPASIAKTLHNEGCMGFRKKPKACPIQRYLVQNTGVGKEYRIEVDGVDVQIRDTLHGNYLDFIEIPPHIEEFIDQFDDGRYPDLDRARRWEKMRGGEG